MKKFIISLTALVLVLTNSITALASFKDVFQNTPNKGAIDYIEVNDIYNGVKFLPSKPITRGEFAEWALRNAGFTEKDYMPLSKSQFIDVDAKEVKQAGFIYKLLDLGVIHTTDFPGNVFSPNRPISKGEALEWMFNLEGISVPKIIDKTNFRATDLNVNSELAPIAQKAIELGMIEPGRTGLQFKLTRATAALFLQKVKLGSNVVTVKVVSAQQQDIENQEAFDTLVASWNRINSSYLHRDKVKKDQLVYGAIEGMVKELGDKHTNFERPGDNGVVESLSNQVEGIGAVLQDKDGDVVVVTPIVGSPAEKAGLRPNDIVREVNGVVVKGMKLTDVVSRIKGKKGTVVKLTVERAGQQHILSIVRDIVLVKSVSYERTNENIFIIRITSFGETTAQEFNQALNEMKKDEPRGIILDLRYNPGGYLQIVTEMAGHFIQKGDAITTVKYPDHEEKLTSKGEGELKGKRIAVLVNGGSASASEILAGALKDYKIATIIGELTYGKGTVQELDDFSDGSTLKLTIAEWLTPDRHQIDGKGIVPNVTVKNPEPVKGSTTPAKDLQMERAKQEVLSW